MLNRITGRPALYTESSGDRHATWLELFFDLVFVLAIAELARFLHGDVSPGGFLGFAALFVPVWWVWIGFTYYADQFDVDNPTYRVTLLIAMLLAIALALSVGGVFDGGSAWAFAATYAALRALIVWLYIWAWWYVAETRALCARYAGGYALGALIWGASVFVPEPARYWLWAAGLAVELATPMLAEFTVPWSPVQVSHLAERFGLFTIIVLGESIVVTGAALVDTDWNFASVVVAVFGFAVVGCAWWLYFDRVDESAVERSLTGSFGQRLLGFVWSYGHLIIFAGLAMTAVGIELAIEEAAEGMEVGARAALCGGVAVYLLAISVVHPLSTTPLSRGVLIARLGIAGGALLLVPAGALLPAPAVVGVLALGLVALTVFEVRSLSASASDPSGRTVTKGDV